MNVVVLIGRLTRDPELRYTNSQMPVCSATLAVDRPVARSQGNEKQTDFIRITLFGKQAEIFSRYLTKGRQVAVEGRIQTGSYQNQKGDTVYTTDVYVNRFDFIGNRNDSQTGGSNYGAGSYSGDVPGGNGGNSYDNSVNQQQETGVGGASAQTQQAQQSPGIPEGFEAIDDDDIPF